MGKKEIRQHKLIQDILELGYIPKDLKKLAETLHVSIRTVQRDICEIREMLPKVALDGIKEDVILRLRNRIPEMKDSNLIRLVEFFVPKKRDVKVVGETKILVKMWPWSRESEKSD